ncbi:MAG: ATP-binding cassette domain-containing protein, partial [Chloroflexota bacterium]
AVAGLSLSVEAGSILGLLGPNGAGKTTTIRMLTTLLPIDGGTATVAGFDVATQPGLVRQAIGLAGQSAAVDEMLTTRQNLDLFGRLYHLSSSERKVRVEGLIDRFQMTEFADRLAGALSGGEKRRLDLVAALIADPPAVFLDEPTTGLDPRGRAALWDEIKAVRDDGAAVVLTTQYLDEADRLADRIVVIDRGTAVAQGTAAELKAHFRRDVLELTVADPGSRAAAAETLGGSNVIAVDDRTLHLVVNTAQESLAALRAVQDADIEVADFQLRRPTLDDVFIELTGAPTMPAESTGSTRSEAEEVTRP